MKNKFLKISTIIMLVITLTMTNFIFVGASLYSYAADEITTNHKNIEFIAGLKDEKTLELQINVKKEGYFNGKITLKNSNFEFKKSESPYVYQIDKNTISLNQMNSGTSALIEVNIEPVQKEKFDIGLLNMKSEISLTGVYKDSTEKDINIKATRNVTRAFEESNNQETVENTLEVITNELTSIDGETKRVIQLAWNMGLKNNDYPIQEIKATIKIPTVEEKQPEILKFVKLNTMTSYDYNHDGSNVEITLKNEPNQNNEILWKKQGNETVILTLIYDKEVKLEDLEISGEEKVTLYNQKQLTTLCKTIVEEEKDGIIAIATETLETEIAKGKLNAGIDRDIQTTTNLEIRLAKAIKNIILQDGVSTYGTENEEIEANITYKTTSLKKEEFDNILGQNGMITILDENKQTIASIDSSSQVDENGMIVVSYEEKEPKQLIMQISGAISEGNLNFIHNKTIHNKEGVNLEDVNSIITKGAAAAQYYQKEEREELKEDISKINLKDATTEVTFETNRDTLSTIITNNVEFKIVLRANDEKYDLYKNPEIEITLPEQIEGIIINSIDMLYEDELQIKDYNVDGRTIKIIMEGEQTKYKEVAISGANIIINADVIVNKKVASKEEKVIMRCYNENARIGENIEIQNDIKIMAPKDVTMINNIPSLQVETMGQEETKNIMMDKGSNAKTIDVQIEMINNNASSIEDIAILGVFPSNTNQGNLNANIASEINLEGIEDANIYYSENIEANGDLQEDANGWKETIEDGQKVAKYLIIVPEMAPQESVQGTYSVEIPENLEYNQSAQEFYQVTYRNSETQVESTLKSTAITMETGIGPKVETKLTANVGNKEVTEQGQVKNGEIISYNIEVSNVGTQDIQGITITGKVPEGTTMVEPEDDYEYTGASYYKELDSREYKETIDNLKIGEVVTKSYEVRVNKDTKVGIELLNQTQVQYGEAIKQSAEIKNVVQQGKIATNVKRVTDRNIDLYETGTVQYFAIIENITNEKQDNVKIVTNLPENLKVERLALITGMKKEDLSEEDIYRTGQTQEVEMQEDNTELEEVETDETDAEMIEYKDEINIGTLEAGEIKVLSYDMIIQNTENSSIVFSVTAKQGNDEYHSNQIVDAVKSVDINIEMEADIQDKYIKAGDIVEYTIKVNNQNNTGIEGIIVKDTIPAQMTVQKVIIDDQEIEGMDYNELEIPCNVTANNTTIIKIQTVVNYSEARDEAEPITNIAYAEILGERVATTSEISHIIQANEGANNGEETGSDTGSNEIEDNDVAVGSKMVSGMAWYDGNANGKKDQGEKLIPGIHVKLLNAQTNHFVKTAEGIDLEVTTNENGMYVFNNIGNGSYIAIFDFDQSKYTLTKYKVNGASESENSDVMKNDLKIEGETRKVASTDIIQVKDDNISDINIGLIELQNFDLALRKYVNKIIIQNASGTIVKEYNDETLAKAEIDAKQINGSNVIIEYTIKVTNNGEIDGYAKKIADYLPNDLKFSSELNKDWYQTGDTLYNSSLANEIIKAGETRTIILTVTKAMTENNTGRINNTAEIAESYNELGMEDSNSVPGNKLAGENDMGSADVILSIKTGGVVMITTMVIIVIVLVIGAVIIIRKRRQKEIEK